MDDQTFQARADEALQRLFDALNDQEFEADFVAGALTIEFEDPKTRFVVSPNSPVRQIWLSANVRSFKLDWNDERGEFCLEDRNLNQVVAGQISQLLGERVEL
jgi:CyaY protein